MLERSQRDIVLTTFNAKYAHAAFGLRYLLANLGELQPRAGIVEFDVSTRTVDAIERLLADSPRIIGVGVYIWNVVAATQLVQEIKRIAPQVIVIIGGPEVSYEVDQQPICAVADYVITGEADLAFAELCRALLNGDRPTERIIVAGTPEFETRRHGGTEANFVPMTTSTLKVLDVDLSDKLRTSSAPPCLRASVVQTPYDLYTDEDLAHRVIYVEASRGCPFKCEFCLSSLDVPVRNVPTDDFLAAMQRLLDRGCRQFKFVDRTFNLNLKISSAILNFFLQRMKPDLFLHFEMIPDRLPEPLRELIAQFPAGRLQFEVGIQSFDPHTQERISRKQDNDRVFDNLTWLRSHTGVHVHADLIVGLPGEDMATFGRGFDRLVALRPQEVQVGMLKRLRGTPIVRHDAAYGMVYSPTPPYEVLSTAAIDFAQMQRMRRFARYWDLVANSGNFVMTLPVLLGEPAPASALAAPGSAGGHVPREGPPPADRTYPPAEPGAADAQPTQTHSAFASFLHLADWLFTETGRRHGISLTNLAELLFRFMTEQQHRDPHEAAAAIWADYQRVGRSDRPAFLKDFVAPADTRRQSVVRQSRQAKHASQ